MLYRLSYYRVYACKYKDFPEILYILSDFICRTGINKSFAISEKSVNFAG